MVPFFWLLVVAVAAGYGTWAVGWLAVPLIALVAGWVAPRRSAPLWSVPLGVIVGWAVLLWRASRAPGFGRLGERLAGIIPLSLPMLIGATLMLGLTLGLGGALLGVGLDRRPVELGPADPLHPRT